MCKQGLVINLKNIVHTTLYTGNLYRILASTIWLLVTLMQVKTLLYLYM